MSKKAFVIWNKILPKISLERLREMRSELGVPQTGFFLPEDCAKWMESSQKEYETFLIQRGDSFKKSEVKLLKLVRFQREIASQHIEIQYGFEQAIFDLILSNKINEEIVGSSESTGCKFVLSTGENKLSKGVYIYIGQNTVLDDIELFIKGKSKKIKEHQLEVYKSKPIRYKPNQAHKNFYRDIIITAYGKFNKSEIKQILKKYPSDSVGNLDVPLTKETLIQRILKQSGFTTSVDNIKQVLVRKKRMNDK